MKLLKVEAKGLPLFPKGFRFEFATEQRVDADNNEMVYRLFRSIYTNNVNALVGLNASGKTTALKILAFVMSCLNGKSINSCPHKEFLGESVVEFEICFYEENQIYRLWTKIHHRRDFQQQITYFIENETLMSKKVTALINKVNLYKFDDENKVIRDNHETYLQDDVSIAVAISKTKPIYFIDMIELTNYNFFFSWQQTIPTQIIQFLDSSIESIKTEGKHVILKFYHEEEIIINNIATLGNYLSSGTIKGINLFCMISAIIQKGGYFIIDEIENHFNTEIVKTIIGFFNHSKINPYGATLILSTHYVELLNDLERNDDIYIMKKEDKLTISRLSQSISRNDINRSEAFKSDLLDGTAVSYDAYIKLKEYFITMAQKDEK